MGYSNRAHSGPEGQPPSVDRIETFLPEVRICIYLNMTQKGGLSRQKTGDKDKTLLAVLLTCGHTLHYSICIVLSMLLFVQSIGSTADNLLDLFEDFDYNTAARK